MMRRMKNLACALLICSTVFYAHTASANDATTLKSLENARHAGTSVKVKYACAKENYALVGWGDENVGGESLYHKVGSKWQLVMGGGGAMGSNDLTALHVPAKTATALIHSYQTRKPGSTSC